MQQHTTTTNDKLMLECRKSLSMTGVETVDGFTDTNLKLTVSGNKMYISGNNIKITAFNKDNGILNATGDFFEIKYATKKIPMYKRLFK